MIEKIRRWFAGIGAAFGKSDKPLPASAEPETAPGTSVPKPATEPEARKAGRAPAPAPARPPAAAAPAPAARKPAPAVETTADDDDDDDNAEADVAAEAPAPIAARPSVRAPDAPVAGVPPALEEIQRRRELVRTLFNDFWSGRDDKPAAFVDRLDEAETYLNERLSASGEPWRLDAGTRKMLGLPARHSPGEGGGAAHH